MSCPYRFDVGVYLLGALDPPERAAFEEHLDSCATCTHELHELAAMPGLLARVPVAALESADLESGDTDPESSDPEPGPDLLTEVMRRRRRERRRHQALAAMAVVVALVLGAVVAATVRPEPATATAPVARTVTLQAVGGAPVRGDAGLSAKRWGTQVSLRCRYLGSDRAGPAPGPEPEPVYVLLVRGPDGAEQQIARWSPPPGQDVDIGAATDLQVPAVTGLEVRTDTGRVVMRS